MRHLKRMGREALCLVLCLFLVSLAGCQTKGKVVSEVEARLTSPLSMQLSFERRGEIFTADVTLGEGNTILRDIEMTFQTPLSVAGLTLTQKEGVAQASFGELSVKEEAIRQIILLLSPFCPSTSAQRTVYQEGNNTLICYVGEGESVTLYVEKGDTLPNKILYTLPGETVTLYPRAKQAPKESGK